MDWGLVELERLGAMRCPSCQGTLGGGATRQVEWSATRCVVVIACPACLAECMAILDARRAPDTGDARPDPGPSPLDVDDVWRAHELLVDRDWRLSELFAA